MAVENNKRLYLRSLAKAMFAVLAVTFSLILLQGLFESDSATDAHVVVSLAHLDDGKIQQLSWRGRQWLLLKRSVTMQTDIAARAESEFHDANAQSSQQPIAAQNMYRSLRPDYLLVAAETEPGCVLDFSIVSGFHDRCSETYFDFSGRALVGGRWAKNLEVPPHIVQADTLVIGRAQF